MKSRILVPLDGSAYSEDMLPYAKGIARSTGARLTLLRVVGDEGEMPLARKHIEALASDLDADGKVSLAKTDVTSAILDEASRDPPALVAMSSHGRTGIVLHWWRGTPTETKAASELGAWFSINTAEVRQPAVLGKVPLDRILPETDHPFGDRQIPRHQPGQVAAIERAIATTHGTSAEVVRRELWRNLARLVDATGTSSLLPDRIRKVLSAAKDPS